MDADPVTSFRRAYWRAHRELDTVRLRQWERSRVTLPQIRVLHHIRATPGITTGELARTLGVTVSTASGLVIKLADRGLVQRTTTPDDRRQAPLHLTEDGEGLVGELAEDGRTFIAGVADLLGDDLAAVTTALQQLADAAAQVRVREARAEAATAAPAQAKPRS